MYIFSAGIVCAVMHVHVHFCLCVCSMYICELLCLLIAWSNIDVFVKNLFNISALIFQSFIYPQARPKNVNL